MSTHRTNNNHRTVNNYRTFIVNETTQYAIHRTYIQRKPPSHFAIIVKTQTNQHDMIAHTDRCKHLPTKRSFVQSTSINCVSCMCTMGI